MCVQFCMQRSAGVGAALFSFHNKFDFLAGFVPKCIQKLGQATVSTVTSNIFHSKEQTDINGKK